MILYKYVSFEVAKLIIETSTIGFSCLEDLNDPFEGTSLRFEDNEVTSGNVIFSAVRNRMSQKFGLLSLTRTPLNSTMWSHYGDDHRGVVIGIDVNIAELNCTKKNLVPANYGDVIYTTTKPNNALPQITAKRLMEIGNEVEAFTEQDYELFKRTFLYKSLPWNYEEEVRVVKNVKLPPSTSRYTECKFNNQSGKWNSIQYQGRPIYCLNIPKESIKEIYLGCATYNNVSRLGVCKEQYLQLKSEWKNRGITIFNVRQVPGKWQLESFVHKDS
ncbi:MAG: DUF2971 domain-containing protein [Paraglaciecola sp.]|uniref:DUF2971 domain-containing protein n=1 Tax=Paraglaciecola sp. TaxID=1920173 RepID=UPI0032977AE8